MLDLKTKPLVPLAMTGVERLRALMSAVSLPQTVSVPWVEVVNNGERSFEYHGSHVKVCVRAGPRGIIMGPPPQELLEPCKL